MCTASLRSKEEVGEMYKTFDVARSKPDVSLTPAGGSTQPKALMFHAIYRNPGGEEQSFANESKLLESIGYAMCQVK